MLLGRKNILNVIGHNKKGTFDMVNKIFIFVSGA